MRTCGLINMEQPIKYYHKLLKNKKGTSISASAYLADVGLCFRRRGLCHDWKSGCVVTHPDTCLNSLNLIILRLQMLLAELPASAPGCATSAQTCPEIVVFCTSTQCSR